MAESGLPGTAAFGQKLRFGKLNLRFSFVKQSPAMANAVKVFCRKK